jgi:hypothetical protein
MFCYFLKTSLIFSDDGTELGIMKLSATIVIIQRAFRIFF